MAAAASLPPGTDGFGYRDGELLCEQVAVRELSERFGTPLYVYSRQALVSRFTRLREAFGADARICYAVKSNSSLALLRLFADLGAGFDLVSGGELARLSHLGIPGERAVFAGVAKQAWEIEAALEAGIAFFNVESPHELELLEAAAAPERPARLALRLNPDVAAGTHDYISTGRRRDKFGLDLATAGELVGRIAGSPVLELVGYHVHLGSQLLETRPYLEALDVVERFWDGDPRRLDGVRYYDLGGGFGVSYGAATPPLDVAALARAMLPRLRRRGMLPVLEPGRFLTADAGVLLTRVLGLKGAGERRFALVDAAMNDLLRPALYRAEHPVAPVRPRPGGRCRYDLVGPVCESGDFLALDRELPELRAGDLVSVFGAGAYGMAMASNYNSRPRAAEVLVEGANHRLIRRRESLDELWATEIEP